MKQKTKVFQLRLTPEEAQLLKEKSSSFHSVSHYILSAVQEFSNVDVRERIELIRELGEFYRKNQNELSWAGGNLNQVVKRANELAVAGLLAPGYVQEIVIPTVRETQIIMERIKKDLELIMNELLEQLQMKLEAFQKDAALQAEKGNKAAGQRARCVSLEMEPLLKQFRKLSLAASKK